MPSRSEPRIAANVRSIEPMVELYVEIAKTLEALIDGRPWSRTYASGSQGIRSDPEPFALRRVPRPNPRSRKERL